MSPLTPRFNNKVDNVLLTRLSKMYPASMRGRRASPLLFSVPSLSCVARSRMTAICSGPSGILLSRPTSSDSWCASLTSKALVDAGGRAISRPNMPTLKARWW